MRVDRQKDGQKSDMLVANGNTSTNEWKCFEKGGVWPVNEPHGDDDWRNLDNLTNEEIHVHVTVEIGRVERQAVIDHRVQRPASCYQQTV